MFPINSDSEAQAVQKEDINRPRINHEIKVYKVRLIDQNGNNVGIVDTRDALNRARDAVLDLVEVSPTTNPPVCKIMDFRKYIFEQKKKMKENTHKAPETHEIRLTPNIDQHDIEVKARKATEFLEDGSKVILVFKVKGREAKQTEFINDVVKRFYALVDKLATLENKGEVFILHPR